MTSLIRQRFDAGKIVRTMHITGWTTPKVIELIGTLGRFHGLWFDQEHAGIPHAQLELMLIACRASGIDAFARVPPTDYATIMRPMEAGCSGVMIAQVRTLDEVQRSVQWAKYPPIGIRGFYGGNAETGFGRTPMAAHVAAANSERWLSIQIETPEAVELADQIAAVNGVDWLFVGPADLSVTLGVPGDVLHTRCQEALKRVAAAAKGARKPWGILPFGREHADYCRELGCQLFSTAGDMTCFIDGMTANDQVYADYID
jgi:2-dehydro-3-deoxyglucarate aldolase/4-hydroxy-2-oxoheptanedioate aldolase